MKERNSSLIWDTMVLAQLPSLEIKRLECPHDLVAAVSVFVAEGLVLLKGVTLPNRKAHVVRLVNQELA